MSFIHLCTAGMNLTADLGPTQEWVMKNLKNITTFLSNSNQSLATGELIAFVNAFFGTQSSVHPIINAVPGSRLFGMVSVRPDQSSATIACSGLNVGSTEYLTASGCARIYYLFLKAVHWKQCGHLFELLLYVLECIQVRRFVLLQQQNQHPSAQVHATCMRGFIKGSCVDMSFT